MALTKEQQDIIADEAMEGFAYGLGIGRKLADELDNAIYTQPEMSDLEKAELYAKVYAQQMIKGLQRGFKRRFDTCAAFRQDVRANKKLHEKGAQG